MVTPRTGQQRKSAGGGEIQCGPSAYNDCVCGCRSRQRGDLRKQITTGSLGGLLTFRSQDLDQARNTLNQMALAFADAMNTQHRAGFDANGDKGGKLFDFGSPAVLSNGKNTGSASVTATMTDSTKVGRQTTKLSITVLTGQSRVCRTTPASRPSLTPAVICRLMVLTLRLAAQPIIKTVSSSNR